MLADKLVVRNKTIAASGAPYVIAEAGSNFDQSYERASQLIDFAADAGADAVKFQLFQADALYPPGTELNTIFKSIELAPDWVPRLAEHAAKRELAFLASAFDLASLEVLERANVPAHKIASSEVTNLPLLAAVARTAKPIFMATGMCDLADIQMALDLILSEGNSQVALMQCGAVYPLPEEKANLRVIQTLAQAFGGVTGFSDHTLGRDAAVAAVALGATVFEKHFTHSRAAEGPDHFYALEPGELKDYVHTLHRIHQGLGSGRKTMLEDERAVGRRLGLHARRDILAGCALSADDVEVRRPATGARGRHFSDVVGNAVSRRAIKAGDPIDWSDVRF
jgi:N,N'-diacetyllegionaminate synthase